MSCFVMSDEYKCFCDELTSLGYDIIFSDRISAFPKPEQKHADMQILRINDAIFMLNECKDLYKKLTKNLSANSIILCRNKAGEKYPKNILLNFLFLNNTIYGKMSSMDLSLKEYCMSNKIKMVNINQGYARCSTLVLNESAVITADSNIENALRNNGAEVLKITEGNIALKGYNYGFIGGASGKIDDNTVVFFGDITKHTDYSKIKNCCAKHNIEIKILSKNIMPLTDIGGIVAV